MSRILLIEPDRETMSFLKNLLGKEGFSCVCAPGAEQGMQRARTENVDLIVMETQLDDVPGLEVLLQLRRDPVTVGYPILMLSEKAEASDRVLGLEMGADDYMAKPFNPREFIARVRALARRWQRNMSSASQEQACETVGDLRIFHKGHYVLVQGRQVDLSQMEITLLSRLTAKTGDLVKRDDLYKDVIGHGAQNKDRALDVLVSRLRIKLGPRPDGGRRIKAVRGEGYTFLVC
jgi:Response regulators consisting of a CheY-like receiver domain and a winged-helix DNA-binding domain